MTLPSPEFLSVQWLANSGITYLFIVQRNYCTLLLPVCFTKCLENIHSFPTTRGEILISCCFLSGWDQLTGLATSLVWLLPLPHNGEFSLMVDDEFLSRMREAFPFVNAVRRAEAATMEE